MGTRRRTEEEAAPPSALRVEVLDCTGPVPSKASTGGQKEGVPEACAPLLLFPLSLQGGAVHLEGERSGRAQRRPAFGSRVPRLKVEG